MDDYEYDIQYSALLFGIPASDFEYVLVEDGREEEDCRLHFIDSEGVERIITGVNRNESN